MIHVVGVRWPVINQFTEPDYPIHSVTTSTSSLFYNPESPRGERRERKGKSKYVVIVASVYLSIIWNQFNLRQTQFNRSPWQSQQERLAEQRSISTGSVFCTWDAFVNLPFSNSTLAKKPRSKNMYTFRITPNWTYERILGSLQNAVSNWPTSSITSWSISGNW